MSDATILPASALAGAEFGHVRVIIGLVTGLSIMRLLNGLARFIQHPQGNRIYAPHPGWVVFVLLFVIHFWWFQFTLSDISRWSFQRYLFILGYAALVFLLSSLLFPDRMDDYEGFADYFPSRRRWFYGLLGAVFVVDIVDSALKGRAHFDALGQFYALRQAGFFLGALAGMIVADRRFHVVFPFFAIAVEVWWIFSQFEFLP